MFITFAEKFSTIPGLMVIAPDGFVNYGWRDGVPQITKVDNYRNDGGYLTFRNGKQVGLKMDLQTTKIMSQLTTGLTK